MNLWILAALWAGEAEDQCRERLQASIPALPERLQAVVQEAPVVWRKGGSPEHPQVEALPSGALALHDCTDLPAALAHAATELLDRQEHWSSDPEWRVLSGWGWGPAEKDSLSYARELGKTSPLEDLATSAEFFVVGTPDQGMPFACRAPGKWRYLAQKFGVTPPEGSCVDLGTTTLNPEEVEAVEVVYVRSSSRAAGSMLGHSLVGVTRRGEGSTESRTETFELAAITGDLPRNSPSYIWRGLSGGFSSRISRSSLRAVILRYEAQNRDVVRLRLHLNEEQKRRLLTRLDEVRQSWRRPYLFFSRNCTYLPKMLVEWAVGHSLGLPRIYGPDALAAALDRQGLVETVPAESVDAYSRSARKAAATRLLSETGGLDNAPDCKDPEGPQSLTAKLYWNGQILEAPVISRKAAALRDQQRAVLWQQMASLRSCNPSAFAEGLTGGESALLQHLQASEVTRPPHTPLRTWSLGMVLRDPLSPGLEWEGALYRFRLGEPRNYSVATGFDGSLFTHRLDAFWTAEGPELEAEVTGFQMLLIPTARPFGNLGGYARLAEVDVGKTSLFRPLEAGAVVEPFQRGVHRDHLYATVGMRWEVAVENSRFLLEGRPEDAGIRQELRLPVALHARIGSAVNALTRLEAAAEWAPALTGGPSTFGYSLDAGVYLGEIGETAVALQARFSSPDRQATLGLAFEPH